MDGNTGLDGNTALFLALDLDKAFFPQDLIPGNIDALDATIEGFNNIGVSCLTAGNGFARVTTGHGWTGEAADAFDSAMHLEPGRWTSVGQALGGTAKALEPYRDVLRDAQRDAAVALGNWRSGKQLKLFGQSEQGDKLQDEAVKKLSNARTSVSQAAAVAARLLAQYRDVLPQKPGMWQRFADGFSDTFNTLGQEAADFAGGVSDGVISTVSGFEHINPRSPYNDTHQQEYKAQMHHVGQEVAHLATHPQEAATDIGNAAKGFFNTIEHNPGRAWGELLPQVLASVATGSVGDVAEVGADVGMAAGKIADGAGDLAATAEAGGGDVVTSTADGAGRARLPDRTGNARRLAGGVAETDATVTGGVTTAGDGLSNVEQDIARIHLGKAAPFGPSGITAAEAAQMADEAVTAVTGAADRILGQVEQDLWWLDDAVHPATGELARPAASASDYFSPKYQVSPDDPQFRRTFGPAMQRRRNELWALRRAHPELDHVSTNELYALTRIPPDADGVSKAVQSGDPRHLPNADPMIRHMASALHKLPDTRSGPVMTGFEVRPDDLPHFLDGYQQGAVVQMPGVTVAHGAEQLGNVQVWVDSSHAKDLTFINPHDGKVVAWSPGTRFRVLSKWHNPSTGQWEIHLTDG